MIAYYEQYGKKKRHDVAWHFKTKLSKLQDIMTADKSRLIRLTVRIWEVQQRQIYC